MTEADVHPVALIQVAAFDDLPGPPDQAVWDRTHTRQRHFLTHDPGGSWVAVEGDRVLGCALALRRDALWGLSLLVVDPAAQSGGIGGQLMRAALDYGAGCSTGVILSSTDPRAMRTYSTHGFDLHPQIEAKGAPRRAALPALHGRVSEGSVDRSEWANAVDREVRGATRGPDHVRLATDQPMYVVDDVDGRGYAYVRADEEVYCLAATDEVTATALLWRCLAHAADAEKVATADCLTAGAQWAIRTACAAGLSLAPAGPVFWRGMTPPSTYFPCGAYL